MARIAEQTIEHIRSNIDIIDLIGQYVQLKKRGHNYFGICPFHLEKTPSFAVNPNKQIYKCFGCGAGGGTINFIMAIEKLEFIESIKFLAEKYNIEIDLNTNKSNKLFSQLFEIHNVAANHYHENLKTTKGEKIIKYLNSRGIKNETIKEFKIGFSLDQWSSLLDKTRELGFSSEAMVQSGLFVNGKKGYYDRFRNRIMFPISDRNNKIIAFGGRVFDSDDPAKYINSSETPIYNKSGIFYGLSKTKNLNIVIRNSLNLPNSSTDIYIVNTIGELGSFYKISNICFIGGSLSNKGGHNLIEPALEKCAIIFGPDVSNQKSTSKILLDNKCAIQINSLDELENTIIDLISNKEKINYLANKAYEIIEEIPSPANTLMDKIKPILKI